MPCPRDIVIMMGYHGLPVNIVMNFYIGSCLQIRKVSQEDKENVFPLTQNVIPENVSQIDYFVYLNF